MSKYTKLGTEVGQLVDEKNAKYGDSFKKAGDYLKLLYPSGVPVSAYQDMLALVRDFDKSMRIATAKDAFGESPWKDKAGYALLALEQTTPAAPAHPCDGRRCGYSCVQCRLRQIAEDERSGIL